VHGGSTVVRRIAVASGKVLAQRTIAGAWGIQRAAEDGSLVAGGDRGLDVALVASGRVDGYDGDSPTTRIALLPSALAGPLRIVRLHGNFGVDALSPDGHYLYLIQHLAGEHYKVRGYDLLANRLDPQTIIDKAEPNEAMAGLPLARTSTADGSMVFTLYRRPSGVPFVHALMATSLFAICIDLPASARVNVSDPSTWGIALRGTRLFVANASTGYVADIAVGALKVTQSAFLGAQPASATATHPLEASSDGARLYLARPQGLVAIDAATLAASAPLTTRDYGSLALADGGTRLFAAGGGSAQAFDASTGAAAGAAWTTGRSVLVGSLAP
jgi:hypothetical protein